MPVVSPEKLASLQNKADDVRNICILAHVDHGKTSLSDTLLATNGIISPKQAGKVRYLDSRPDEQLRGITMESSAISLYFSMLKRTSPDAEPIPKEYLINLIDSRATSTSAARCLRLLDYATGLQVWIEKLKPLLVFNKMDRLVAELQMTPEEAYQHLSRLLEQVNAVLGSFFQGDRMVEDLNWRENVEKRVAAKEAQTTAQTNDPLESQYEEADDEDLYFAPEKNNVIFSSAIDGWAFTVRQFSALYEKKLGIKRANLEKVLWGNFYLDPKTKKLLGPRHLKGRPLKPLFVQLVLDPIWAVYKATTGGPNGKGDPDLLEKITKTLNVTLAPHILRSRDPRLLMTTLRDAVTTFKKEKSDPVVVYVSKIVSVAESELPKNKRRPGQMSSEEARELARKKRVEAAKAFAAESNPENDLPIALDSMHLHSTPEEKVEDVQVEPEHLIGFARIYSGTLSVGDQLYVVPPKWSPEEGNVAELQKVTVASLYMFMGRNLEELDTVPAGVVFGIGGLEGRILKSGTLCSIAEGAMNLAGVNLAGKPIVRVALEPVNPGDLDKMISGLRLLVQSDPCAEYEQFESGEHVLLTAGELHLERCIKDLQERFARCEIQVGAPIVPYRETIVRAEEMRPPANKDLGRGTIVASTGITQVTVRLHVRPLPQDASEFLVKHAPTIRQLYSRLKAKEEAASGQGDEQDIDDGIAITKAMSLDDFKQQLQAALENERTRERSWKGVVDQISAFGPRRTGPNILVDATKDGALTHLLDADKSRDSSDHPFSDRVGHAFQLATLQGPLCNEPMQGVAVFVDEIAVTGSSGNAGGEEDQATNVGRLTGDIIKMVQKSIHAGFLDWSPRLMLAMYMVEVQASMDVLGRVNDVLTRRRGRVVDEAMKEGTPFFTIQAMVPAAESFGFADEMRKRTSGAAQPQLIFAGFEIFDEDPLWQPFTEDDLEDLGELADRELVAKKYMDGVRKRKGLLVEGRNMATIATKQKTLKR
ncbi:unnamed protein product [Parascedosporium putredinis]|uniref:Elongation factor-like 1 n=1 Tax=Parascedosporium putredinis TaxID=1442378 RepID=A0A9P1MF98_9PEZI|nr:unnamed protein product [Parascedosporium putredinis]CAI8003048.1 unnamed protein product [Parascedosporium putredinis]